MVVARFGGLLCALASLRETDEPTEGPQCSYLGFPGAACPSLDSLLNWGEFVAKPWCLTLQVGGECASGGVVPPASPKWSGPTRFGFGSWCRRSPQFCGPWQCVRPAVRAWLSSSAGRLPWV